MAKDLEIPLDALQVVEVEGVEIISAKDTVLVGITDADARAVGKNQQELATMTLTRIKAAIAKYRQDHIIVCCVKSSVGCLNLGQSRLK